MQQRCGWSRSTTLTLLSRMEAKGAVAGESEGGKKAFRPLVCREDAALQETEDFLERVYKGSLSLMEMCIRDSTYPVRISVRPAPYKV